MAWVHLSAIKQVWSQMSFDWVAKKCYYPLRCSFHHHCKSTPCDGGYKRLGDISVLAAGEALYSLPHLLLEASHSRHWSIQHSTQIGFWKRLKTSQTSTTNQRQKEKRTSPGGFVIKGKTSNVCKCSDKYRPKARQMCRCLEYRPKAKPICKSFGK